MVNVVGYQWPIVTMILMMVYSATLIIYLGWPISSINTKVTYWPFLSFMLSASLLKIGVPIISVLLSTLKLTVPGILYAILLYILAMLFNSVSLLTLMTYYALFANSLTTSSSFGNDALYCCQFYGSVPACPASYGPCGSTPPILSINPDVYLLMGFSLAFILLEVMAFFFINRMYQYYTRVYELAKARFQNQSTTKKSTASGPSLMPEKLKIPFLTTTVPKVWSEFQKRVDGLFLMDDSHIAMAEKYANIKKQN